MSQAKRKPLDKAPAESSEDSESDSSDEDAIHLSPSLPSNSNHGSQNPNDAQPDPDPDPKSPSAPTTSPHSSAQLHPHNNTPTETLQISFDFCDFRDEDLGMTRALLGQGAWASIPHVRDDLSQLETSIVEQKAVGTTIRVDDAANAGEIYSFITALPLRHLADRSAGWQSFRSFLMAQCPQELLQRMKKLCSSASTALVVNERIVNMPRQLAQPLHQALIADLEWARVHAPDGERMFAFDRVIMLCPVVAFKSVGDEVGRRKQKKRKQSAVFLRFDDEVMVDAAEFHFICQLEQHGSKEKEEKGKEGGAVPQRHQPKEAVLCCLTMEAYKEAVEKINQYM